MNTKATKLDATTFLYRGFRITPELHQQARHRAGVRVATGVCCHAERFLRLVQWHQRQVGAEPRVSGFSRRGPLLAVRLASGSRACRSGRSGQSGLRGWSARLARPGRLPRRSPVPPRHRTTDRPRPAATSPPGHHHARQGARTMANLMHKPTLYSDPATAWFMQQSKAALADMLTEIMRLDSGCCDDPATAEAAEQRFATILDSSQVFAGFAKANGCADSQQVPG
jgi:hypothetical protein